MADSRRWNGQGVQRDDQFVRPPAFRDAQESDHLTPEAASWHGSGSRHVALATGLALAAGIAAVALMLLVSPSGGGVGSQAPLGAEGPDDPAPAAVDVGAIDIPAAGAASNGTTSLPVPVPPLP